ncbi:LLM class flavin-dependent oxidoreductase [Frondihabitans cladoniiphilus]|uniref:Luciferase-like domain-containing protein n=1 Tax=Frondihabitans cladoniiphilus TaxID=715785 RepID=A0ABP8VYB0_9MICO
MIITTRLEAGSYPDLDEWAAAVAQLDAAPIDALVVTSTSTGARPARFEPTTLAAYLGQRVSSLGIVAEDTALLGQPFHVARRLATLDHLTGGRAGWLLGTTSTAAEKDGYEFKSPSAEVDRVRATEFTEIVLELWDSWESGAERPDKRAGDFHDDARVHAIDYRSTAYLVRGPLDVPRTPQGRPVLFADLAASADGADAADLEYAALFADVVVVRAGTPDAAVSAIGALRASTVRRGREGEVRMLVAVSDLERPGCVTISAETAEAVSAARSLVEESGADGIEVVADGSPEGLDWLAEGLAPALGEARASTTLMARLGLDDVARFGRRAA